MLHVATVRPTHLKRSLLLALLAACILVSGCGLILAKVRFGCLPEGTAIDSPSGSIPVEQIRSGDQVTGYHGQAVTVRQIHQYQEHAGETRHLAVTFTNGSTVHLSPRHRIAGIPAGKLKPGDRLGSHTIADVVPFGHVSRSFDLLTDDPGYRIQGIPVNSMIEEMAR